MSLLQQVNDVIAHERAHGYANEMSAPVERVLQVIAAAVEQVAPGTGADVAMIARAAADTALKDVHDAIATLSEEFAALRAELEGVDFAALRTIKVAEPPVDAPQAVPLAAEPVVIETNGSQVIAAAEPAAPQEAPPAA